jgi:hypothetical protein
VEATLRKQEAGVKRKLCNLQKQQAVKIGDAERMLAEIALQASKLPGVSTLLQPYV